MFELHIGDLAELYVLGELDPSASARPWKPISRAACNVYATSARQKRRCSRSSAAISQNRHLSYSTGACASARRRGCGVMPVFALAAAAGFVLGLLTMVPALSAHARDAACACRHD